MSYIDRTIAMLKADEKEIVTEMKKELEVIVKENGFQEMADGYFNAISTVEAIFKDRYKLLESQRE